MLLQRHANEQRLIQTSFISKDIFQTSLASATNAFQLAFFVFLHFPVLRETISVHAIIR
jgi:hypothetical protein